MFILTSIVVAISRYIFLVFIECFVSFGILLLRGESVENRQIYLLTERQTNLLVSTLAFQQSISKVELVFFKFNALN